MSQGEARMLETDVVIFPLELNQQNQGSVSIEETIVETEAENKSIRTDLQIRFARLKKSLRRRSVSIF